MSRKLDLRLVLIMSLLLGPTAFASDEMSNEEAATLIKKHEMFGVTNTIKLVIGTVQAKLSDVEHYQPNYVGLRSIGLIDLASVTIESPDKDPKNSHDWTRVSLTEKGLKESEGWTKGGENVWIVTIAVRQLVEVIKVHKDGEERIHGIEFTWTWAPNKIGDGLKFTYPPERAYAKLERDGNDWRIVSIRAIA